MFYNSIKNVIIIVIVVVIVAVVVIGVVNVTIVVNVNVADKQRNITQATNNFLSIPSIY